MTDDNQSLLLDLYELTMAQAYVADGMLEPAVFTLYLRKLPDGRNYALACGLDAALTYLETLRFGDGELEMLRTVRRFGEPFLKWLGAMRFTGDVYAVPEGTPVFPGEPILEVVAPLPEAQLVETMLLNQIHVQTVHASKAARLAHAAGGVPVIDFGLRRTLGADAGLKLARASYIGGLAATSNVLAGALYGIPVRGTMAHSYVQAHDSEMTAFRAFIRTVPDATLLIDTYDTMRGLEYVIQLAAELGDDFKVRSVRVDSGDLAEQALAVRRRLDEAGLQHIGIVLSGNLNEWKIADMLRRGIPVNGFGVGTELAASPDAPVLDVVYKLAAYRGRGRLKTSPGKETLPGRKQVFRVERAGRAEYDVVAAEGERLEGRALLAEVMRGGARTAAGSVSLEDARSAAAREIAALPEEVRSLAPSPEAYRVEISQELEKQRERIVAGFLYSGRS